MIRVSYETDIEYETYIDLYVNQKGYRLSEVANLDDGNYLFFAPPTKYHTETENGWDIDIDTWLNSGEKPDISDIISINDTELNNRITAFYYNQVDPTMWRIDNYELLRKTAYPDITEKVDAEVKINSGIESLVAEGEAQLAQYVEDCLNVKTRFQKE